MIETNATYGLGDTDPGGGIIFYVSEEGFTAEGYSGSTGSFGTYTAHYLEAAPIGLFKKIKENSGRVLF